MISLFSARDGNFGKLQDCHEAYQVLLKIIKVLSENLSIFNPFMTMAEMSNVRKSNDDNKRIRIGSQVIFFRKLMEVKERKAKKWLFSMMIIKYNVKF